MRELVREFNGSNSYLRYNLAPTDQLDTVSLAMLTHNRIDGVVPTQFRQIDDTKQLLFNVSGMVSASDLFNSAVSKTTLLRVLRGIVTGFISAEEYRLLRQSLILSLDCVFVDLKSLESMVLCLPLRNISGEHHDLRQFFKELVFNTKGDATSGYDHIAQIMSYLNGSPYFNMREFRDFLDQMLTGKPAAEEHHDEKPATDSNYVVSPPSPSPAPTTEYESDSNSWKEEAAPAEEPMEDEISLFYLLQHYNAENAEKYRKQQQRNKDKKGKKEPSSKGKIKTKSDVNDFDFDFPDQEAAPLVSKDHGADVHAPVSKPQVVNKPEPIDYGVTVLLSPDTSIGDDATEGARINPNLVSQRTGEKIFIDAAVFRIGRKQSEVNYCIPNNKTVGRVHAQIVARDGEFFVCDLNSANHTYLNGVEIEPGKDIALAHGSKLVFSDEEYEFSLI